MDTDDLTITSRAIAIAALNPLHAHLFSLQHYALHQHDGLHQSDVRTDRVPRLLGFDFRRRRAHRRLNDPIQLSPAPRRMITRLFRQDRRARHRDAWR